MSEHAYVTWAYIFGGIAGATLHASVLSFSIALTFAGWALWKSHVAFIAEDVIPRARMR